MKFDSRRFAIRNFLNTNVLFFTVREHPKEGSYVANLTTIQVSKFEDILSLM